MHGDLCGSIHKMWLYIITIYIYYIRKTISIYMITIWLYIITYVDGYMIWAKVCPNRCQIPKVIASFRENDDQICNGMGFVIGRQTRWVVVSSETTTKWACLKIGWLPTNWLMLVWVSLLKLQFCWYITILRVTQVIYVGSKNPMNSPPINIPMLFPHITF